VAVLGQWAVPDLANLGAGETAPLGVALTMFEGRI